MTGSLALVLGWALALVIYFTNPGRLQNRALALFMALVATGFGVGVGVMFAADAVERDVLARAGAPA